MLGTYIHIYGTVLYPGRHTIGIRSRVSNVRTTPKEVIKNKKHRKSSTLVLLLLLLLLRRQVINIPTKDEQ